MIQPFQFNLSWIIFMRRCMDIKWIMRWAMTLLKNYVIFITFHEKIQRIHKHETKSIL